MSVSFSRTACWCPLRQAFSVQTAFWALVLLPSADDVVNIRL